MIADNYLQLRTELETALAALLKLSSDMRRDSATLDTLHGLLTDIREPLLFVVVGEVKAGKSSLLNALFGQEFAKVDVRPATDRVYIFRYGRGGKIGRGLSPAHRALSADFIPARLQRGGYAGHEHDGGRAPDHHREFCPSRGSCPFCFLGREPVVPVRLGPV